MAHIWRHAWRRSLIAIFSICIGAAALSIVKSTTSSFNEYFSTSAKEIAGGDIVLSSNQPIPIDNSTLNSIFSKSNYTITRTLETLVSARSETNGVALSLLVIDSNYPLYGTVSSRPDWHFPNTDEMWIAENGLTRLGITIGDTISIGETSFIIAGVIDSLPDRFSAAFNFGPRAVISHTGWETLNIDKSGSRIEYTQRIAVPLSSEIPRVVEQLRQEFPQGGAVNINIARDEANQLERRANIAERFFLALLALTVLLTVANTRVTLGTLLADMRRTLALIRCYGMSRNHVIFTLSVIVIGGAISSALLGHIIGWYTSSFLVRYAASYLNISLPFAWNWYSWIISLTLGISTAVIGLFSVRHELYNSAPRSLLHDTSISPTLSQRLWEYGFTITVLFILFYISLSSFYTALWALIGTIGIYALFYGIVSGTISAEKKWKHGPLVLRAIFAELYAKGIEGKTALAGITLALTALIAVAFIHGSLVATLNATQTKNLPNLYFLDIQTDQRESLASALGVQPTLFPIVRGRITSINGQEITLLSEQNNNRRELRREFNFTYRDTLSPEEKIVRGEWHKGNRGEVSVDAAFAQRVGIKQNDRIDLLLQGVPITAKVTSIREVDKSPGMPFFYFVLSPNDIADAPHTWFGYTTLPENDIPLAQNRLALLAPNITSFAASDLVRILETITTTVSLAVGSTAGISVLLGMILLIGTMIRGAISQQHRIALWRALGARRGLTQMFAFSENILPLLLSCIPAYLIGGCAGFLVGKYFLDLDRFVFPLSAFLIGLCTIVITSLLSLMLTRRALSISPATLLRSG